MLEIKTTLLLLNYFDLNLKNSTQKLFSASLFKSKILQFLPPLKKDGRCGALNFLFPELLPI